MRCGPCLLGVSFTRSHKCPVRVPEEGYVLHSYGKEAFLRHAVASVVTLRRHDTTRPVALFCSEEHCGVLQRHGLSGLFSLVEILPPAHRSIVGFKHHLHRFMPFERCLFVDADMVWCRDPDPLWMQLSIYPFTATGLDRADFYFGGPKGIGVIGDMLTNRRRRTLRAFGLTYLPRVQAGMIYACEAQLTRMVCESAAGFLTRRAETHFRTRFSEGRAEESCEWSLAMAMSQMSLPTYPWYQGLNSPQLDYIPGMTRHTGNFEEVSCLYYCDRFIFDIRGLPSELLRKFCLKAFTVLLRRHDHFYATPFALHFSWLHAKRPFQALSERIWSDLTATA